MKINNLALLPIVLSASFLAGCITHAGDDQDSGKSCAKFLKDIPVGTDNAPVSYDLEEFLNISTSNELTVAYDALQSIESGCGLGEIVPDDPEEIMAPWEAPNYVDVLAGISGMTPWVQFVYPSIGEFGPGLASSVVFYDEAGRPIVAKLVSEYHSWENTSVLKSVLFKGKIESCRQYIEYFSYGRDGDIAGELDSPVRSECKLTTSTYPYP
ncbi:hypothetical protein [Luteimonas sp. A478]